MADEILSEELTAAILKILKLGVTPAISIFGVIGNIFSVIVLAKHGLNRSSNILLVSLAISDITFLVGFNSVPKLLYEIVGGTEGFVYDPDTCYIVPSRWTWTAVIVVSVFWYGFFIHMTFYVVLDFELDQSLNLTVGVMRRSEYHKKNPDAVAILEEVMSYLCSKIPPVITFLGCVTIGIKIKMASSERRKLTSRGTKGEPSTRTTRMLLAVCAVYTVACVCIALPTFIPQYMHYSITNDAPSNLGRVLYQATVIVLCINSSCNFIIYVVINKNFRSTYLSLFTRRSGQHNQ
ncbi:hypothetical protein Btru_067443 [Bulinus truncatus]|nr:hypothetical protein Btru_067443 [Bulinus truncatus]